jgi:anti-sigma factor RsiW
MDTCSITKQRISAHLDGELPDTLSVEVSAHLARCPACAAYRDELIALDRLLDDAPAIVVDDTFTAGVLARVREREGRHGRADAGRGLWVALPRWAVAAIIIFAISVGSGLALLNGPDIGPPPAVADSAVVSSQFGLDAFDALSGDTIVGAYLQVTGSGGGDGS